MKSPKMPQATPGEVPLPWAETAKLRSSLGQQLGMLRGPTSPLCSSQSKALSSQHR